MKPSSSHQRPAHCASLDRPIWMLAQPSWWGTEYTHIRIAKKLPGNINFVEPSPLTVLKFKLPKTNQNLSNSLVENKFKQYLTFVQILLRIGLHKGVDIPWETDFSRVNLFPLFRPKLQLQTKSRLRRNCFHCIITHSLSSSNCNVAVSWAPRVIKIRNLLLIMQQGLKMRITAINPRRGGGWKLRSVEAVSPGAAWWASTDFHARRSIIFHHSPAASPRCLSVSKSVTNVCHLAYMAVDHVGNVHVPNAART